MAAQGYQESTLDQNVKSPVGAIGVMQVMPPTGKELNVGDISEIDANIHAGVKYMRFMIDRYYEDEPMDNLNKALMTFASYNAGPGRVRQLRREAKERGLDPNVWFGNVERVASERIGRETVTYVSNIFKYYVAYKLLDRSAGAARRRDDRGREAQMNHSNIDQSEEKRDMKPLTAGMLAIAMFIATVAAAQIKTLPGESITVTATVDAIERSSRTADAEEARRHHRDDQGAAGSEAV